MSLYDLLKTRILYQFRYSTNLLKLFENVFDENQSAYDLFVALRDNRDVDSATGVWLDIVGDIVALPRPFLDIDKDLVFSFLDSGGIHDPDKGFYDIGPPETGGLLQYSEGLTATPPVSMGDEDYRKLIKAKAVANNVGGSIPDLHTFLENYANVSFSTSTGEVLITVNEWMGVRQRVFTEKFAPRPSGIRLTITNW